MSKDMILDKSYTRTKTIEYLLGLIGFSHESPRLHLPNTLPLKKVITDTSVRHMVFLTIVNGEKLANPTEINIVKQNLIYLMIMELTNMFGKPYNDLLKTIPIDSKYILTDDSKSTLIWLIPADLTYTDMLRLVNETFSIVNRGFNNETRNPQELSYELDMINMSQSILSFLSVRGTHDLEILAGVLDEIRLLSKNIEQT